MKLTPEMLRELVPDDEVDRLMENAGIPSAADFPALSDPAATKTMRAFRDGVRELIRMLLVMRATDTPLPPAMRALIEEMNRLVQERLSKLKK